MRYLDSDGLNGKSSVKLRNTEWQVRARGQVDIYGQVQFLLPF